MNNLKVLAYFWFAEMYITNINSVNCVVYEQVIQTIKMQVSWLSELRQYWPFFSESVSHVSSNFMKV